MSLQALRRNLSVIANAVKQAQQFTSLFSTPRKDVPYFIANRHCERSEAIY